MRLPSALALLLAALLAASPHAAADPVQDAYASAGRIVEAADGAARAIAGAALAAAERTAGSVLALAGPFGQAAQAVAQQVLVSAGNAVPDQYVGLGQAVTQFRLQSGNFVCNGMTALVEHRTASSNEPNFVFNVAAGEGLPTLACKSGLRFVLKQGEWSGSPEEGWHGQRLDTPDAKIIDITIGPVGPDGTRPFHVFYVTLDPLDETYLIDGWLRDTL